MLRKILLVIVAIVFSLALTIFSGYILYKISDRNSEMQLSLMIRFIFNPIIAMLAGVLVGALSKDHPALTSIVGLVAGSCCCTDQRVVERLWKTSAGECRFWFIWRWQEFLR
jgi:hypothetical protein